VNAERVDPFLLTQQRFSAVVSLLSAIILVAKIAEMQEQGGG
jgi:hypothetical protein